MIATVCKTCGHTYYGSIPAQCVDCHGTWFGEPALTDKQSEIILPGHNPVITNLDGHEGELPMVYIDGVNSKDMTPDHVSEVLAALAQVEKDL